MRKRLTKAQWEEIAKESVAIRDGVVRLYGLMRNREIKTDKASIALRRLDHAQSQFRCDAEDQMFLDLNDSGNIRMFYPGPTQ